MHHYVKSGDSFFHPAGGHHLLLAEKEPISDYDWGFVGVSLVCELYVLCSLWIWAANGPDNGSYAWLGSNVSICIICFSADIGFSVAKLFPGPEYMCEACDTWSCRKVTHTCTMTLCSCVFGLIEAGLLHWMTAEKGTKTPILLKIVEYSASLGFVLYDALSHDPPGAGTTVLVVFASLAEILLISIEVYTFWKYYQD